MLLLRHYTKTTHEELQTTKLIPCLTIDFPCSFYAKLLVIWSSSLAYYCQVLIPFQTSHFLSRKVKMKMKIVKIIKIKDYD